MTNLSFILSLFIVYVLLISSYAILITILDKQKAKQHKRRISEKHLFIAAVLGGALAMYITMKCIHHKTKHKRFMIGLPVIFIIHLLLCVYFILYKIYPSIV